MATGNASQPDALTQETREDRGMNTRVAIPVSLTGEITIDYLCRTSLSDTLIDNFGMVKIDENYDPVKRLAVVYPNNITPARAQVLQALGSENAYVGKDKMDSIRQDPDYKLSKGKHKIPRTTSGKSLLYYATINTLYIGYHVPIGKTANIGVIETIMASTGMKLATSADVKKIIIGAQFPKVALAQAPNGLTYPVDPSKEDSLPKGWFIKASGLQTHDDLKYRTKRW
jgi:hypothetical protein